jgi:hypothetical protein
VLGFFSFAYWFERSFSFAFEKTKLVCSLFLFSLKEWIGCSSLLVHLVFDFLYSRYHSVGPF